MQRTILLVTIVVAFAASACVASAQDAEPDPDCYVPETMGHRGYAGAHTENTLGAFRAAFDAGATWVEADVRWTRTGSMMVMHDKKLNRTTTGTGKIAKRGGPYIRRHPANDGQRVPWVTETLRLARDMGGGVALHVKPLTPASAERRAPQLIRAIYRTGMQERVMILSRQPATIAVFERLAPELDTAQLLTEETEPIWFALTGVDYVHPRVTTPETLALARENGLKILVSRVTAEPLSALEEAAVDGADIVMTDETPQVAAFYRDRCAAR